MYLSTSPRRLVDPDAEVPGIVVGVELLSLSEVEVEVEEITVNVKEEFSVSVTETVGGPLSYCRK